MNVRVNGEPRAVVLDDDTVSGLLVALGCVPERVAVEQNGVIVRRDDRPATRVHEGDVFEIVTLVGGG